MWYEEVLAEETGRDDQNRTNALYNKLRACIDEVRDLDTGAWKSFLLAFENVVMIAVGVYIVYLHVCPHLQHLNSTPA